jgi:2-enoate reductase
MGRIQEYSALNCAVNPTACREKEMELRPALKKKKVLIVGGGVAGCEAARVLALRGHEPVTCEKENRLGGNLIPGGSPDFKEDDLALVAWYENILDKLGVEIHLNTKITLDDVKKIKADEVIVSTGSVPKMFDLGGGKVYSAADVLLEKVNYGERIVVVGGGLVGCELALSLAKKGKKVTIVELQDKLLAVNGPLCHANSEMLERLIPFNGIEVLTSSKVVKATEKGAVVDINGIEKELQADSIVLAVGYSSEKSLYEELKYEIPNIHIVGDARKVANIMYAIWDAYEVARYI